MPPELPEGLAFGAAAQTCQQQCIRTNAKGAEAARRPPAEDKVSLILCCPTWTGLAM